MALAFLLLAHKNPDQISHLFHTVHRPENTYVLHFDRRSPDEVHRLGRQLAAEYPNVIVLPPQPIVWGGFAAAQVQLSAMEAALGANADWHHFINISGQDFPLKPIEQLDERLADEPETNYVPWFDPLENGLWRNARDRIERVYLARNWLDRVLRIRGLGRRVRKLLGWENRLPYVPFVRRRPPPFRYYGGSNYVVLSRAAADYCVFDPRAIEICRWLRHSLHPDEIFIQTILMNSPLADTVVNENLHEIDFPAHSPHPRTYTTEDLDRLTHSPKFLARKFDRARDPNVLERLAENLG